MIGVRFLLRFALSYLIGISWQLNQAGRLISIERIKNQMTVEIAPRGTKEASGSERRLTTGLFIPYHCRMRLGSRKLRERLCLLLAILEP
jgi:hypothetical protein